MFRSVKTIFHACIGFISVLLAYQVVLAPDLTWWITSLDVSTTLMLAGLYALVAGTTEIIFKVERSPWRFVSTRDAFLLLRSTAATALVFLLALFILYRAEMLPRSVLLLAWILQLAMLAGARLLRRAVYEGAVTTALAAFGGGAGLEGRKTVLLVGTVDAADSALRDLSKASERRFLAIGVVSPDLQDRGKLVRNVPVAGNVAQWDSLLPAMERGGRLPDAVLFLTDPAQTFSAKQLGGLAASGVKLLRLPRISEVEDEPGPTEFAGMHEIGIEELLSRVPIKLDFSDITSFVSGKRVLVTGAGGSIGSEICRQVAALGCAHLTMLDQSEFLLFNIDRETADHFPALSRRDALCNVRDRERIQQWFLAERPDVVFHAAALKHVSLVESHPDQGFLTNVIGTLNVTEAAQLCGATDFVMISTDKAVAPSNVMGATKRLAEAVVREAQKDGSPLFTVVRFGNVLGSAGSVVPIFKEQIARGGPVTVTHADVERYFMTIPEAVQLVLHAAATRVGGTTSEDGVGIHVLDMGDPVRVHDLAERMTSLSGKTVGKDIQIEIIGLRPGEKLTEELVDETEEVISRGAGVIRVIDSPRLRGLTRKDVEVARRIAESGDHDDTHANIYALLERVRFGDRPRATEAR